MKRLTIILLLFSFIAGAQKKSTPSIGAYMKAQEQFNEFSGVVYVVKGGKTLYKKAFGTANREWDVPNTISTRFRLGSITKQFTATSILQLVSRKKLALTDHLSRFYPDFPKGDSVTIHMLLNHTSGIRSFTSVAGFGKVEGLPLAKDSIIALFKNEPYDFSPGSSYAYNNSAYFLLATIIEKLSGLSYEQYVQQNILGPVGLKNTGVEKTDSIMKNNAAGYRLRENGWRKARPIALEIPLGGGNMVSNVEDLYRWQRALYKENFIADSLYKKMITPYLSNYGYAMDVDSLGSYKRLGHDGNIPGFASYCYYYPDADLSVIVLSNKQGGVQWLGQALAAVVLNMEVETPYAHRKAATTDIPETFTGIFETPERRKIILTKNNGKLQFKTGNATVVMEPESETRYFLTNGVDMQVFFKKESEEVKAFVVRDGLVSSLRRVN